MWRKFSMSCDCFIFYASWLHINGLLRSTTTTITHHQSSFWAWWKYTCPAKSIRIQTLNYLNQQRKKRTKSQGEDYGVNECWNECGAYCLSFWFCFTVISISIVYLTGYTHSLFSFATCPGDRTVIVAGLYCIIQRPRRS